MNDRRHIASAIRKAILDYQTQHPRSVSSSPLVGEKQLWDILDQIADGIEDKPPVQQWRCTKCEKLVDVEKRTVNIWSSGTYIGHCTVCGRAIMLDELPKTK